MVKANVAAESRLFLRGGRGGFADIFIAAAA